MTKDDIVTLLQYTRWANEQLLSAAEQLPSSSFTKTLGGSYPSVRDTFTHILWGEWLWLQRWQGGSPRQVFEPAEFPDVAALRAAWAPIHEKQEQFLAALHENDLAHVVEYHNRQGELWSYPLSEMIQHVANHSTYHRGQVAGFLRQLGLEPPPTDFLIFADRRKTSPSR